jgi:hypothetical protein
VLPGASGTINLIGFDGYGCACALVANAKAIAIAARRKRRNVFGMVARLVLEIPEHLTARVQR